MRRGEITAINLEKVKHRQYFGSEKVMKMCVNLGEISSSGIPLDPNNEKGCLTISLYLTSNILFFLSSNLHINHTIY